MLLKLRARKWKLGPALCSSSPFAGAFGNYSQVPLGTSPRSRPWRGGAPGVPGRVFLAGASLSSRPRPLPWACSVSGCRGEAQGRSSAVSPVRRGHPIRCHGCATRTDGLGRSPPGWRAHSAPLSPVLTQALVPRLVSPGRPGRPSAMRGVGKGGTEPDSSAGRRCPPCPARRGEAAPPHTPSSLRSRRPFAVTGLPLRADRGLCCLGSRAPWAGGSRDHSARRLFFPLASRCKQRAYKCVRHS